MSTDAEKSTPTATSQKMTEQIAEKVEAAEIQTLGLDGEDSGIGEILSDLLSGDLDPEDADDAIRRWVNEQVDVPFIGEAAESRLLKTVQTVVKSAVVDVLRSL